jgi:hypothetical protein
MGKTSDPESSIHCTSTAHSRRISPELLSGNTLLGPPPHTDTDRQISFAGHGQSLEVFTVSATVLIFQMPKAMPEIFPRAASLARVGSACF